MEYRSALCYSAEMKAAHNDEARRDVQGALDALAATPPSLTQVTARDGCDVALLDETGSHGGKDLSMFARTSLKSFVGLLRESPVDITHVYHIIYKLRSPSGAHVVVLGTSGFHLCSCLHLLQHGFPCRHYFACLQLAGTGSVEFDPRCVHPRWRSTSVIDDGTWTASAVLRDAVHSEGDLPQTTDDATANFAHGNVRPGQRPRVSEGARKRLYVDCLAALRGHLSRMLDTARAAEAVDITNAACDLMDSRSRAGDVFDTRDGGSLSTLPSATPRERATRRVPASRNREEDLPIRNPLPVRAKGRPRKRHKSSLEKPKAKKQK